MNQYIGSPMLLRWSACRLYGTLLSPGMLIILFSCQSQLNLKPWITRYLTSLDTGLCFSFRGGLKSSIYSFVISFQNWRAKDIKLIDFMILFKSARFNWHLISKIHTQNFMMKFNKWKRTINKVGFLSL